MKRQKSIEIDRRRPYEFDGDIGEAIAILKAIKDKALKDGFTGVMLSSRRTGYEGEGEEIVAYGLRDETDQEAENRKADEKFQEDYRVNRRREEYEKLKKEFGQ